MRFSPAAVEAVREAVAEAHLYPDGGAWYLKSALAEHLDVGFEELIVGNGSNEIIELLIRTFVHGLEAERDRDAD